MDKFTKSTKLSKYQEDDIFGFPEDEIGSTLSPSNYNPSSNYASPKLKPKKSSLNANTKLNHQLEKSRSTSHPISLQSSQSNSKIPKSTSFRSQSSHQNNPNSNIHNNYHHPVQTRIDEISEESDLEVSDEDFTNRLHKRYELSEDERYSSDDNHQFGNNLDHFTNFKNFQDEENFEDGFEDDFGTIKFDTLRLDDFKPEQSQQIPSSSSTVPQKDLRKFKSSVNLNSKVISKLDRIPSFYNRKLSDMIAKEQNYQITKSQLLAKYKEVDKQHQRTKKLLSRSISSNAIHDIQKQDKQIIQPKEEPKKYKMKTIKTNEVPKTPNMKFNSNLRIWEGNASDLKKFEKPSTINLSDYKQIKSNNMIFDSKNMKWVKDSNDNNNLNNDEVNEIDEILMIPDLQDTEAKFNDILTISNSKINRWLLEEDKIKRKISGWGNNGEFSYDYLWDIRKLVMES